jgi:hypothetical protein
MSNRRWAIPLFGLPAMSSRHKGILFALMIFLLLVLLVAACYWVAESRRKSKFRQRFHRAAENSATPATEHRRTRRLAIPAALAVSLSFTEGEYFGLTGRVVDIGTQGFGLRPDFPLKRLPLHITVNNVLVSTPINTFMVKEARTVRIEHIPSKRLLGLEVVAMAEDQQLEMNRFMAYVKELSAS